MLSVNTDQPDILDVSSWKDQYWHTTKQEFSRYVSAENTAKCTVPASIVFGASALGFLIGGGPVGAAAGAYIGNTIVGHTKPKDATNKIQKSLVENDSE